MLSETISVLIFQMHGAFAGIGTVFTCNEPAAEMS